MRNFTNGDNGTLYLDEGEIRASDAFLDIGSGTLKGNGNLIGDFVANGLIEPGFNTGRLDFFGDLALGLTSSLEIELAGISDHDLITVSRDLILDGQLEVDLINGFELTSGQTFSFLEVAGMTGGNFEGLLDGDVVARFGKVDLRIDYGVNGSSSICFFTTSSIPEPCSGIVLAASAVILISRRRRS
ncbi:MAG: hypothetical protein AAF456_12065 [Planctomycetota bacterium]